MIRKRIIFMLSFSSRPVRAGLNLFWAGGRIVEPVLPGVGPGYFVGGGNVPENDRKW